MIHIIYGEEDFLVREKIIEISNNSYKSLSFADKEFAAQFSQAVNRKLWQDEGFIVVKNVNNELTSANFVDRLRNLAVGIIFVVSTAPTDLTKQLKKAKIEYILHQLDDLNLQKNKAGGATLEKWLNRWLLERRVKLEPAAVSALVQIFSASPGALLAEVEKLAHYRTNQVISNEELKSLIRWPNESKVFETVDFLKQKNWPKFFRYLKREIMLIKNPAVELPRLLGLIQSTIFSMLLVKKAAQVGAAALADLPLNAFYKKLLLSASHKFSPDELKRLYNIIALIERRYKKFQLKPAEIAEEIMLNLGSPT